MKNNTEKLLEVARDEEEFGVGKWDSTIIEKTLRGIFITLKPQPRPNMAKTHFGISAQTTSNYIPKLDQSIFGLVAAQRD